MAEHTYTFPAGIGEQVYIITKSGYIHEAVVDRYIVQGKNPHDNRVRLAYIDRDGMPQTTYRAANLFGRVIFTSRNEAEQMLRKNMEAEE